MWMITIYPAHCEERRVLPDGSSVPILTFHSMQVLLIGSLINHQHYLSVFNHKQFIIIVEAAAFHLFGLKIRASARPTHTFILGPSFRIEFNAG